MIVSNRFLFFCLPPQALPRPTAPLSRSFHLSVFTPGRLSGGLTARGPPVGSPCRRGGPHGSRRCAEGQRAGTAELRGGGNRGRLKGLTVLLSWLKVGRRRLGGFLLC